MHKYMCSRLLYSNLMQGILPVISGARSVAVFVLDSSDSNAIKVFTAALTTTYK